MTSKTLTLSPQPLRVAFFSMLGVAAVAGTLNGAAALGGWSARTASVAEPAPVVALIQPKAEVAEPPPPPAFRFDAPLPGRVINSPFGLRQLPWEENGRLHEGVDIAAPSGAPVKAAADGVVKATGTSPTYGRYVQVMHKGGLTTLYAHLAKPAKGVKRGTYLRRGDTVAFVGNSGRSTGSHLHFEIRKGDKALNPTFFLGRSFAEASDLPLKAAGRVSRKVHVATVSAWPKGVSAKGGATSGRVQMARLRNGRVRASIPIASTPVATVPAPAAQPATAASGLAI